MKHALPVSVVWLTIALLLAYVIVLVWIGQKGKAHAGSIKGFTIAKGTVKPWVAGAAFGASFASANLFLGVPGLAYRYGASVLWWALGCFGVTWFGLLLFAKMFWRHGQKSGGVLTLPHWLGTRYNSKILQFLVSLLILFNIYYIVSQNVGLATIFQTIIGLPYLWAIAIGVAVTLLYVSMGGAFSQFVINAFQAGVMAVTGLLVVCSLLWTTGGGVNVFGQLSSKLAAINPHLISPFSQGGPFPTVFAVLTFQWLLFSFVLLPHLVNSVLTLDEEKQLRPFTLSAGITLFFVSTLTVFGGLAARVLIPHLQVADKAIPMYLLTAFPPVVVAVLTAGIISAILSTTDSLYLGITSCLANDIYKSIFVPFLYRNQTLSETELDRRTVKVAKISLILIGIAGFYMSIHRPASLALLTQFGISAIISGIVAPISLGYFWGKANGPGAIASLISGSGLYITLQLFHIVPNVFESLFYSSIVGFLVMIAACPVFGLIQKRASTSLSS